MLVLTTGDRGGVLAGDDDPICPKAPLPTSLLPGVDSMEESGESGW